MSLEIPSQDTNKKEDELWQIIENQSSIISELQKALNDMTFERDNLLKKLKSFTNDTIPTPPPRSPFRFSNTKNTDVEMKKDDEKNRADDKRISMTVKSVKGSSFVLSVINAFGQELWDIEKFYSDFLSLHHMVKSMLKENDFDVDKSIYNQHDDKKKKTIIEDYFKQLLLLDVDLSCLYSFITPKKKKEGYLYKREKYGQDGWKKYYFILSQSELFYYSRYKGRCIIQSIPLVIETQVGRQTANQNDSIRFAFIVLNEQASTIMLSAKSDKEREKWIQALVHRLVKKRALSLDEYHHSNHSLPNLYNKSSIETLPIKHQEEEEGEEEAETGIAVPENIKKKNNHKSLWPLRRLKKKEEDATLTNNLFGCPIEEVIQKACIVSKEGYELPSIVYRCIEFIELKITEEGIYRLSGNLTDMNKLKTQFCEQGDIVLTNKEDLDTHIVTGLLKMWLRELPENILTNELLDQLIQVTAGEEEGMNLHDKISDISGIVHRLPLYNYQLLYFLCSHFVRVIQESKHNKMTSRNMNIVFSPTLSIPTNILRLFINEFDSIFNCKQAVFPEATTSADRIKEKYLKNLNNKKSQSIIV